MHVTHFRSPECFRLCFSPSRKRFYLQSSLSLYLSAISPLWILQSIRRILCILRVWICFRILFLFLKLSLSSAIPSSSFKIYWNTFLSMTAFCRFTCVHSSCHHFLGLDKCELLPILGPNCHVLLFSQTRLLSRNVTNLKSLPVCCTHQSLLPTARFLIWCLEAIA